jgi:ADP-heptose:LPS heptosyltransferase
MTTLYLHLNAAMGDTLYLLAACRAIKKLTGAKIVFLSQPHFVSLVQACPHVDETWPVNSLTEEQNRHLKQALAQGKLLDFTNWAHALRPVHMIDSFLAQPGLEASAQDKQLDLNVPQEAHEIVESFYEEHQLTKQPVILLHPNIGHPNRTWPQQNWYELAEMLMQTGWQVIFIGSHSNSEKGKTVVKDCPGGVISAIDRFSPLETIALMKRANMLVSCDSGPVMLAAATSLPIVALYSTVAAEHRLPFRQGKMGWRCAGIDLACSMGPCARLMLNEAIFTTLLKRDVGSPTTEEFANWCIQRQPFHCLQQYHPAMLFAQLAEFYSSL